MERAEDRREFIDSAAAAARNELSERRSARGRDCVSARASRKERCGRLDASRPTPTSMAGQLEKRREDPTRNQQGTIGTNAQD